MLTARLFPRAYFRFFTLVCTKKYVFDLMTGEVIVPLYSEEKQLNLYAGLADSGKNSWFSSISS